jgi:hypothetical protein
MQRFMDKWGLWAAFVIVGSIIAYGLIAGLMKAEEKPTAKNAALQGVHGNLAPTK